MRRRYSIGMSFLDAALVWVILIVLAIVGYTGWRDYTERTAGVDCETEAPRLAEVTDLPLAACPKPRAAPPRPNTAAAAPRPAAAIDRARLAGEISGSWSESLTLSFDGGDAVLQKRSSWLNRLISVPFNLLVAVLGVFSMAALLGFMGAGLINLAARRFRRGTDARKELISEDRKVAVIVRLGIVVCLLAFVVVLASAAKVETIRISPERGTIATTASSFGFAVGISRNREYHAAAPVRDKKGRALVNVYARDDQQRLARVYRLQVREEALPLAGLLMPKPR